MSASPVMMPLLRPASLPRTWPAASIAAACARVEERRRPHCLRLVQASEDVSLEQSKTQRNPEPGLAFYRKYTEALLRRYMKMSLESGRAPSLLGREFFSGEVTNYTLHGFDDAVIFVHDVGRCLEQLDPGLRHLVRRIALEEYTLAETAAMLGIHMRTVLRRYGEAIDKLTRVLIDRGILQPNMADREAN